MDPKDWTPETIRELRRRLKLTQREFADRLGVARQQTIALWEGGHNKPQRMATKLLNELDERSQSSLGVG